MWNSPHCGPRLDLSENEQVVYVLGLAKQKLLVNNLVVSDDLEWRRLWIRLTPSMRTTYICLISLV